MQQMRAVEKASYFDFNIGNAYGVLLVSIDKYINSKSCVSNLKLVLCLYVDCQNPSLYNFKLQGRIS